MFTSVSGFTPTVAATPVAGSAGATPVVAGTGPGFQMTPQNFNLTAAARSKIKLPKDANRIIYVRGLPFKISSDELYDIFGKYGSVRQIRKGINPRTRGSAFVVYDDVYDAKNAVDHLSGFNVAGRYLVVLYYDPVKEAKRLELKQKNEENMIIKQKSGFV